MREAAGKDLSFPAARTKDGETFASELVCEEKGRGHLGFGRRGRQIDGFRDSAVAISLKHRLHTHMMLGWDIMRRDKQSTQLFGDMGQMLNGRTRCQVGLE